MSETPIVDLLVREHESPIREFGSAHKFLVALLEKARQLERALAAAQEALQLIACPMRPDGTWNRDREACRALAQAALDATRSK